jgi:hypothetical protein
VLSTQFSSTSSINISVLPFNRLDRRIQGKNDDVDRKQADETLEKMGAT